MQLLSFLYQLLLVTNCHLLLMFGMPFRVPETAFRRRCRPHPLYVLPLPPMSAFTIDSIAIPKHWGAEIQYLLQC